MRTVEDDEGNRYLLITRSGESSRVRDPDTGTEQYLPNDVLTPIDVGQLEIAAEAIHPAARAILTATRDERTLGLLLELRRRGPTAVRTLLDDYDLCESDLLGATAEFRAAGLVQETDVSGEQGYQLTEMGEQGLAHLIN